MARCCYPDDYGVLFGRREAVRTARRFRRRGLSGSARDLAAGVVGLGVDGASILEVGGGVGDIQIHLLEAGAARATNIELSPNWEEPARRLVAERGLKGRVDRRLGDFVDEVEDLPEADVVVLHRVLCCYPDGAAMMAASVSRARRVVALTVPVDRWWTRVGIATGNGVLRLMGRRFRAFVHPMRQLLAVAEDDGLRAVVDRNGLIWRTLVLAR